MVQRSSDSASKEYKQCSIVVLTLLAKATAMQMSYTVVNHSWILDVSVSLRSTVFKPASLCSNTSEKFALTQTNHSPSSEPHSLLNTLRICNCAGFRGWFKKWGNKSPHRQTVFNIVIRSTMTPRLPKNHRGNQCQVPEAVLWRLSQHQYQ